VVTRLVALVLLALALSAASTAVGRGDDAGQDVRVAGNCTRGVISALRARARDARIELRFRIRQARGSGLWRITVVHERRVAARATRTIRRAGDSFELRRVVPDLQGSDTILVRAWGPRGLGCSASATLAEAP